jgi:hypothetical protein
LRLEILGTVPLNLSTEKNCPARNLLLRETHLHLPPILPNEALYAQNLKQKRRVVRVVEGARLESVYTPKGYLGFESLTLRNRPPMASISAKHNNVQYQGYRIGQGKGNLEQGSNRKTAIGKCADEAAEPERWQSGRMYLIRNQAYL